jgi:hypothetical protein
MRRWIDQNATLMSFKQLCQIWTCKINSKKCPFWMSNNFRKYPKLVKARKIQDFVRTLSLLFSLAFFFVYFWPFLFSLPLFQLFFTLSSSFFDKFTWLSLYLTILIGNVFLLSIQVFQYKYINYTPLAANQNRVISSCILWLPEISIFKLQ